MIFTPEQHQTLMRAFSKVEREIGDEGFICRVETDFDRLKEDITKTGKPLSPWFWSDKYDFNGHNAFCMVLEKDGQGLVYICNQRMDLGARTLEQAYIQRLKALYSHDPTAKLDETWTCEPLQEVTGVVAYSGDAVTHPDLRSCGFSLKSLGLVSRLSLFYTLTYWDDVDWIVGTIPDKNIKRGLGWAYGGNRCYAMAEEWKVMPEDGRGKLNAAIVLSSRKDVLWTAKTVTATHRSE
ncbi:hypothetical protein [Roseibium alexandrii]|uniref:hypothetical protein n=1 Tax=Roseibium alexandrii TaxID=388408 RepID=UPI00375271A2